MRGWVCLVSGREAARENFLENVTKCVCPNRQRQPRSLLGVKRQQCRHETGGKPGVFLVGRWTQQGGEGGEEERGRRHGRTDMTLNLGSWIKRDVLGLAW